MTPPEYKKLLKYKTGLTDLVKTQSGMDSAIDFRAKQRAVLRAKIEKYQPRLLCFNGKRAAREYLGRKVNYGLQKELIIRTRIFVAPSTSRAANRFWNFRIYKKLKNFLE